MNPELLRAAALLRESEHTLVLLRGEEQVTSDLRGIRPLLELLDSGRDFSGFVAADRIVGKAAALLYVAARRCWKPTGSKPRLTR